MHNSINNNNNNMCFASNLRCCDDLLIMLSRNVFWGATRPLRPAGILRPQIRPMPEVVVVVVVDRIPRQRWRRDAVAHARAHQNKTKTKHLIPFSSLLRPNGLHPLQTYLTLSLFFLFDDAIGCCCCCCYCCCCRWRLQKLDESMAGSAAVATLQTNIDKTLWTLLRLMRTLRIYDYDLKTRFSEILGKRKI